MPGQWMIVQLLVRTSGPCVALQWLSRSFSMWLATRQALGLLHCKVENPPLSFAGHDLQQARHPEFGTIF